MITTIVAFVVFVAAGSVVAYDVFAALARMLRARGDRRDTHAFDADADLTPQIRHALTSSAAPAATLHDLWPWMPATVCHEFTQAAVPLTRGDAAAGLLAARQGADLTALVERFAHSVRCEWADYRAATAPPVWRRLLHRLMGEDPS